MNIVTISRELGSRGTRIAEAVAEQLGAVSIDKEALSEMAREAGLDVDVVVQAEERLRKRGSFVSGEMRAIFSASQKNRPFDKTQFMEQMTEAMHTLAASQSVVFVGRGAQLALRDHPNALHVHLYAPPEVRAQRIQQRRSLASLDSALRIVQQADEQRRQWYLQLFTGTNWKNPQHYHLMLDTHRIDTDLAVSMIAQAATVNPS